MVDLDQPSIAKPNIYAKKSLMFKGKGTDLICTLHITSKYEKYNYLENFYCL